MWSKSAIVLPVLLTFAAAGFGQITAPQAPGGAASLAELRQAYLDAVRQHNGDHLAALYLWTGVPEGLRKAASEPFSEPQPPIASAEVQDADPATLAKYKSFHTHFNATVLKALAISFATSEDGVGETKKQMFIGRSGDRFYFVTAIQDGSADEK